MTEPAPRKTHFTRRNAIVAVLVGGLALLGLGAVPWVRGSAAIPGADFEQISSTGGQAAPLIPALGLVLLAAAVALALARQVGVRITCLIIAAAGAATTVVSGVVLNNPVAAMSAQVTEVTAILLPPEAISDVGITIWVAAAAVFGAVLLATGIAIWRAAPQWSVDRRHEKAVPAGSDRPADGGEDIADADLWDMLSDGQDPTP